MLNQFSLEGKLALISGGATGIGFASASAVIGAGGKAVIIGRREDALKTACEKLGGNAAWIRHDIADLEAAPGLIDRIESDIGPIDILLNNAGGSVLIPFMDITPEYFSERIQTQIAGSFVMSREVVRYMLPRKSGAIVFITSMLANIGMPAKIEYTAAKTALQGMARAMSTELAPHGVRVNSIAPGWIGGSGVVAGIPDNVPAKPKTPEQAARNQKVLERTPLHTFGEPSDVANAFLYLVSPGAKFVTGIEIKVDGGMSVGF
jgi:gluconate 5-dehydrogenase